MLTEMEGSEDKQISSPIGRFMLVLGLIIISIPSLVVICFFGYAFFSSTIKSHHPTTMNNRYKTRLIKMGGEEKHY